MRILITGATGFIGRHLVERLAPAHEIYALVRQLPAEPHRAVHYCQQDLATPLNYATLPTQVDAIIHQAALIDTDTTDDTLPFLVNVVATWRLLTYAATTGVRTFLHASTGGIYGCSRHPFQESDPPNPLDLYSLTKAQAELAVQSAPGDFQRIVLRYFYPYGIGTPNPIPSYVRRAIRGEPIQVVEGGGPRFNPVQIDDAVAATIQALALTGNQTINIAGSEVTTFGEIAELAARLVGREPQLQSIPLAATIPYYRADLVASIERMETLLKFRPQIALADGIRQLVDQMLID
jgi:UDP-glucose 4-epimerase